ncbi:MAG: hypothetical protein DME29_03515 [Verrucomicrobia bacterium]|nr:MAG: hypothetical protein DME29_03515 [Verrucomicrobiota bacterium]PYM04946.1 MAG: hypothetical protein DMF13_00270 [Verrucomicrobiota bacterium]
MCDIEVAGGSSSPVLDVKIRRQSRICLASPGGAADPPAILVWTRGAVCFSGGDLPAWFWLGEGMLYLAPI